MTETNAAGEPQSNELRVPQTVTMRTIGYHFGGMSFYPGRDGVRDVTVGEVNMPGCVAIKVIPSGTGKKVRIFVVPMQSLVIENEEAPIIVPGGGGGLIVPA